MHTCTEYDVNWTRSRPVLDAQSIPASLAMLFRLSDRNLVLCPCE